MCFHREPANADKIRDHFFINRTNPLWSDLPVELKEAKSLTEAVLLHFFEGGKLISR